jgi:hypothetical protein
MTLIRRTFFIFAQRHGLYINVGGNYYLMKNLFQTLIFVFAVISFTACEPKPRETTITFHQDTVINGVKTQRVIKTGKVRRLANSELDSMEEIVENAAALTIRYVPRITNEDTVAYLDRLIEYWHQDSRGDKMTKDQINQAVAMQFGQALMDNNNFEWILLGNELIIEEKQGFGAERPFEISKAIIDKRDSLDLQRTRSRIKRDVSIIRQLDEIGRK